MLAAGGVVIALLAQTGALFFWGGKTQARLDNHDDDLDRHDTTLRDHGKRIAQLDRRRRNSEHE